MKSNEDKKEVTKEEKPGWLKNLQYKLMVKKQNDKNHTESMKEHVRKANRVKKTSKILCRQNQKISLKKLTKHEYRTLHKSSPEQQKRQYEYGRSHGSEKI